MQRFRADFWAWLCLTNAAMPSESKYLADLWVGFLGKKPQTLLIPIYSTTILYDKETGTKGLHQSNLLILEMV